MCILQSKLCAISGDFVIPFINYPFTNPDNYAFNTSDIEVTGGVAQLVQQSAGGQIFNEDFADDTGFTYDSAKAEFVGGLVRQIASIPAATFGANYNVSINGNWGVGSITGTAVGGASISGGKLDLKGGTLQYVDYNAVGNADSLQVGAVKFKITPNYTGNPVATRAFFAISQITGSANNRIQISHLTTGQLRFIISNNVGASIFQSDLGLWVPVASTEYEFEINWDITAGASRVFIDGVQFGPTATSTGIRSGAVGLLRVGTQHTAANNPDFEIDDFMFFNVVQHTANYTPGYSVSDNRYPNSNVDLPIFTHAGIGTIIILDGLVTTESGTPRYTFSLDGGSFQYWTGSAWAASDSTYAQANDAATANTNLPTLAAGTETTVIVRLHFPDSPTINYVGDLTVTYTGNTVYTLTDPIIIPNASITLDGLNAFTATVIEVGGDAVQFTLQVDGQAKYWDGAAWVDADGTYAQSNDLTTIQTNLAAWTDRGVVLVNVFLHTNDGSTTPNIDLLTIDYDFYGGAAILENVCTVWGYLYDELNAPVENITVSVTPTLFGVTNNKLINRDTRTVLTDSTGYWEFTLIETQTNSDSWAYKFELPGFSSSRYVPNTISARFNDLEIAA